MRTFLVESSIIIGVQLIESSPPASDASGAETLEKGLGLHVDMNIFESYALASPRLGSARPSVGPQSLSASVYKTSKPLSERRGAARRSIERVYRAFFARSQYPDAETSMRSI